MAVPPEEAAAALLCTLWGERLLKEEDCLALGAVHWTCVLCSLTAGVPAGSGFL